MSTLDRPLRIGTRGSPLALAQARETQERLERAHPGIATELVVIKTTGDQILDRRLSEIGGKGLFTKELDAALAEGRIDCAVHSMKDLETALPQGTLIVAHLEREDPRDAFIGRDGATFADLPKGAIVGTASLRRQAQILSRRPDLTVIPFRGNVNTRLGKLAAGEAAATLLAMAGLRRLAMQEHVTQALAPEEMLPAVAQGAIGIQARADDAAVLAALSPLDHAETRIRVTAERAMLAMLDGSCRTPIAGLAEFRADGALHLRAMVARPDGHNRLDWEGSGAPADAETLGKAAGQELRARMGEDYFA